MQKVRVLIVDDHHHAREEMRNVLEKDSLFEIVAEAQNGQNAIQSAERMLPDLILMTVDRSRTDDLDATKKIKLEYPFVKIVWVTATDDITHFFEALKNGAQGYLVKHFSAGTWLEYLRAIVLDDEPMPREFAVRIMNSFSPAYEPRDEDTPLTPREKELLCLVADGLANRDIAKKLVISEHTVKNHLKNILQKLHLDNRVQLARYAYERGYCFV
ncbi:response regulator transcription factor [Paenibacillus radicis (ex Gao et al. 2016)]|uniref:DNA-binding response regulator n=1 Tax=Paenibacillus radicis (ex Gao et al. 2016) TaxID=1737354 RepID=A0A917HID8_9BACL|nr:response regulator transcription factor [Paenibacillus radicis (ex Gao et al. 2016)]GGG79610.1 DNA-binding response regulator [Paenibacillus radicis (ex Gao et al. 2016)]